MKRSKPLQRKTYMRRSRPRRIDRPGSDPGRLAFCRSLPCVGCWAFPDHVCSGRIEANHHRAMTGLGRKEPDSLTAPFCGALHFDWTNHRGRFAGWTKLQRFAFMVKACDDVHGAWLALTDDERATWTARARTPRTLAEAIEAERHGRGKLVFRGGEATWEAA